MLHVALEGGNEATSGMGPDFVQLVEHMDGPSRNFLAHWLRHVNRHLVPPLVHRSPLDVTLAQGQLRQQLDADTSDGNVCYSHRIIRTQS